MNPPTKKLSFGLNKAALPRQAIPPKKGKAKAFQSFGSDDEEEAPTPPPPTAKGVSTSRLSKQQRLKQEQELELDKSAYEYDEVYDAMKQGEKLALESIKKESTDRKVSNYSLPLLFSSRGVKLTRGMRVCVAKIYFKIDGNCRIEETRQVESRR